MSERAPYSDPKLTAEVKRFEQMVDAEWKTFRPTEARYIAPDRWEIVVSVEPRTERCGAIYPDAPLIDSDGWSRSDPSEVRN